MNKSPLRTKQRGKPHIAYLGGNGCYKWGLVYKSLRLEGQSPYDYWWGWLNHKQEFGYA